MISQIQLPYVSLTICFTYYLQIFLSKFIDSCLLSPPKSSMAPTTISETKILPYKFCLYVTLYSYHNYIPNIPLYSLFIEIVSFMFKLRLFYLLECPSPPIVADKSHLILQGSAKTLYLLRRPLKPHTGVVNFFPLGFPPLCLDFQCISVYLVLR